MTGDNDFNGDGNNDGGYVSELASSSSSSKNCSSTTLIQTLVLSPKRAMVREQVTSCGTLIPDEIIEGILWRLPAKSLLRFRCVCKSLNSLITDPYFVKKHLNFAKQNADYTSHQIIMESSTRPYVFESCSIYSMLNEHSRHALQPVKLDYYQFREGNRADCWCVGTCDGLVCIASSDHTVELWNPTTRICKKLPEIDFQSQEHTVYGFGYDCLNDDYKVVAVLWTEFRNPCPVQIFSLKENSWGRIQDFPYGCLRILTGVFVGGALNWIAKRHVFSQPVIVSLDLATETYREISMPASAGNEWCLGVLDECLCIFRPFSRGSWFELWMMKEYGVIESWTRLVKIPQFRGIHGYGYFDPVFISKTGDFILKFDSSLFLLESKENRVVRLGIGNNHSRVDVFIESLVPPTALN